MNPRRWQKTKTVFMRAAAIRNRTERDAYLQQACRGAPSLRDEVESLLANQHDNGRLSGGRSLRLGTTLLYYQLRKQVGQGSRGTVYKAYDIRLGRFVALKVLPFRAMDSDSRNRLLLEARCAAALSHPATVTIHDIAQDKGVCFIVMEYVPGTTLRRAISRSGLPVQRCLDLAIQIAEALAKAHALGIIYRDVKPSNILITPDGRVKIVDFGLAKSLVPRRGIALSAEPTAKGIISGTPAYMSPEQARGKKCDGRSDIFSFGVMLHEMLTGRRVFSRRSAIETMTAVLTEEPPEVLQRVPEVVRKVVCRCLRKNPAHRFRTMRDVLAKLKAARAAL